MTNTNFKTLADTELEQVSGGLMLGQTVPGKGDSNPGLTSTSPGGGTQNDSPSA